MIITLAALWCLLCCSTVMADVDITVKVSGTVYASSLPDQTIVNIKSKGTVLNDLFYGNPAGLQM